MARPRRPLNAGLAARLAAVRGYLVVAAGSAGARVLSFAAAVLIARSLGPAEFGDVALFLAVMAVVSTAGDFVDVTYVRHANLPDAGDPTAYLRAALAAKAILSLVLVAGAFPVAAALAHHVFGRPELTDVLAAAIVAGAGVGLVGLVASTYLARRRYAPYSAIQSVFYLVVVATLALFPVVGIAVTGERVYAVFLATALVLGAAAFAVLAVRVWPVGLERSRIGAILRFARWLFAANVVQMLHQRLDIVLLARYVEEESVGVYGAALRIGVVGALLIGALAGFLLPRVAPTRTSREAFVEYLRDSALLVGVLLAFVAALWAAAPALVALLFGDDFAAAASVARVILVGTALFAISVPLVQLMLARDVPHHVLVLGLVRLGAVLPLTIVLAPRLGAHGAAWAYTASEAVALAYAAVVAATAPRPARRVLQPAVAQDASARIRS